MGYIYKITNIVNQKTYFTVSMSCEYYKSGTVGTSVSLR